MPEYKRRVVINGNDHGRTTEVERRPESRKGGKPESQITERLKDE